MSLAALLARFSLVDGLAVVLFASAWLGIGWHIEHSSASRPSVSRLVAGYRRDWMVEMVTRQPRIFDSAVLGTLRQGISFFASATMIAIGGGLALIGDPTRLAGLASGFGHGAEPNLVWQVKLLPPVFLLAKAFLSFVWAHRLFGYCAVVMASVPNDATDPKALPRAGQAAELNITAARSFNRGLRAVYFSMASLAWLIGPLELIAATLVTLVVLWRREFASQSRRALLPLDG